MHSSSIFLYVTLQIVGIVFSQTSTTFPPYPPCPNASNIEPCWCSSYSEGIYLYCEDISTEDQLESVFSAYFPFKNFNGFDIRDGPIKEFTRDVAGDVTFQVIYIETNETTYIGEEAFAGSRDYLRNINVRDGLLTDGNFPFYVFPNLPNLEKASFTSLYLTEIPDMSSNTLEFLYLHGNQITTVRAGCLANLPNLRYISLENNPIDTIEEDAFIGGDSLTSISLANTKLPPVLAPGTFANLPNLELIVLFGTPITVIDGAFNGIPVLNEVNLDDTNINLISTTSFGDISTLKTIRMNNAAVEQIEPGAFVGTPNLEELIMWTNNLTALQTGTFDGLSLTQLDFRYNYISVIEEDAFGSVSNSKLFFDNNNLVGLDESWMRPVLERDNTISFYDNYFSCGCEIAWVFEDPKFQDAITGYCPNGTSIKYLNSNYYIENC